MKPFVEIIGKGRGADVAVAAVLGGEDIRPGLRPVHQQAFESSRHGDDAGIFRFAGDGYLSVLEVNALPRQIDGFVAPHAAIGAEYGEQIEFGGAVFANVGEQGFEFDRRQMLGNGALDLGRFDAIGGESRNPSAGEAPAEKCDDCFDVVADGRFGAKGEAFVPPFADLVRGDFVERRFGSDGLGKLGDDAAVSDIGGDFAARRAVLAPIHHGRLQVARIAALRLLGFDLGGVLVRLALAILGKRLAVATSAGEPVDDPRSARFVPDDGGHGDTLRQRISAANCNRNCNRILGEGEKKTAEMEEMTMVARLGIEPRTLSVGFLGVGLCVLGGFGGWCVGVCGALCNRFAIAGGAQSSKSQVPEVPCQKSEVGR